MLSAFVGIPMKTRTQADNIRTYYNSRRRWSYPSCDPGFLAMGAAEVIAVFSAHTTINLPPADARFGSKADICAAKRHVRFTPKSGHSPVELERLLSARSGIPTGLRLEAV